MFVHCPGDGPLREKVTGNYPIAAEALEDGKDAKDGVAGNFRNLLIDEAGEILFPDLSNGLARKF